MDVYKSVPRFFGSLEFSGILIVAGFLLLFIYAKRSETARRGIVIDPNTQLPATYPIYPAFRRAVLVFGVALGVALLVCVCYKTPLRLFLVLDPLSSVLRPPPVPGAAPALVHLAEREAPKPSSTHNPAQIPAQPPPVPINPSSKPATLIDIPLPIQTAAKPSVEGKVTNPLTVKVGRTIVRASDKPSGTLYVSVRLSSVSEYRGTFDNNSVGSIKAALENTGKIVAFIGNTYVIVTKSGADYGAGSLASNRPRTIFYFDKNLETVCTSVQSIISDVIGMPMSCMFRQIPPVDSDGTNIQRDFWLASGLDMEKWL
jgi:hypothetical protein